MTHPQDCVKDVINSTKGNLCVIDGSLLAFRASAAGEKRSIIAEHRTSGNRKPFDNRTAFKSFLKETNESKEEGEGFNVTDFLLEDVLDSPPEKMAFHTVKEMIKYITNMCGATEYRIFIDEGATTRDFIATVQKYKGNRDGSIKPTNLQSVKDYMVMYHNAEMVTDIEVDDLLAMYGYEGWKLTQGGSDRKIVACTFDKDHLGCASWMFDFRKNSEGKPMMSEPQLNQGFGELYETKQGIKGFGRMFLYHQWLAGDSADNYKPSKLSQKRFGEKSSYKVLKGLKTDKECLQAVVAQYKEWYPEPVEYTTWDGKAITKDWLELMQEYFDLARMQRWPNDTLGVKELLIAQCVDFE